MARSSTPIPKVDTPIMPKKRKRFLREPHEEEHREDVEHPMRVFLGPVDAGVVILRRLPDVDFLDAESLAIGEHRQETVLVAVQRDFFQHLALHGARVAAEIAQPQPRDARYEAVKSAAAQLPEPPACARPAVRDRDVGSIADRVHQLADLGRVDLIIGGQGDDDAAAACARSPPSTPWTRRTGASG